MGARFLTRDPIEAITREAYSYAGNNPVNYTDPSGLIGPLAIGLGYLAIEAGLSLWDAYDAYTTLSDDCAGGAEKWFAGGAFLAGVFMPGNIGWADNAARNMNPFNGPVLDRVFAVDSVGNVVPVPRGHQLTASPDSRWIPDLLT